MPVDVFLDRGACHGSLTDGDKAPYATGRTGLGLDLSSPSGVVVRLEASFNYKAGSTPASA